jgi:hypothetical protein
LDGSRRLTRRRRSSFGSSSDFKFSTGASGSGTIITDPSVVAGGVQSANAALFGNYIAASFVTAAGGQGVRSSAKSRKRSRCCLRPQ